MLMRMKHLMLMRSYDPETEQFEARANLTKAEKKELLALDEEHFHFEGEHMIVNYKDLMESDEIVTEDGEIVPRDQAPSVQE